MPESIAVGETPSGGGIGGIPTKYVILGAGVIGVAGLLIWQSGKGKPSAGTDTTGDVQPTGSVSAELSSVQQMQLQQFGELTKLFAAQSDLINSTGSSVNAGIGNLSSQLDTQAGNISSALSGLYAQGAGISGQTAGVQQSIGDLLSQFYNQTANLSYQITGQNEYLSGRTIPAPPENVAVTTH